MIDWFGWKALNCKMDLLIKEVKKMVDTQADLDTAVSANTAAVTANTAAQAQVVTDINALLAKIAANPTAPVSDFTSEVNALSASTAALSGATTSDTAADVSAQGVINPPAPPAV